MYNRQLLKLSCSTVNTSNNCRTTGDGDRVLCYVHLDSSNLTRLQWPYVLYGLTQFKDCSMPYILHGLTQFKDYSMPYTFYGLTQFKDYSMPYTLYGLMQFKDYSMPYNIVWPYAI
jgi:hypothetical protein